MVTSGTSDYAALQQEDHVATKEVSFIIHDSIPLPDS
jgi:hypothetical protein